MNSYQKSAVSTINTQLCRIRARAKQENLAHYEYAVSALTDLADAIASPDAPEWLMDMVSTGYMPELRGCA